MLFNRACTQKTGFFENLTFSFNFILIVFRHSKNRKKYPRHKIDVNFPAESIPIVRIHIYTSIFISKFSFFCLFSVSRLPIIFYVYSEFRFGFYGKFYTGYSALKIFLKIFAFDTKLK